MASLDAAEQRLDEAISRLEVALSHNAPGQGGGRDAIVTAPPAHDLVLLEEESARLRASLQQAEHERASVSGRVADVAERLDRAIADIDRLIGE